MANELSAAVAPEERTFGWVSDNPLARAVARIPLPIRAKQLVGSIAVAALLALVAVLGLVALGQSNSRGTELKRLQQQGGYEQLLLTDATQLKQLLDLRLGRLYDLNDRPSRSGEPDLPAFDPSSYQQGFLSALDQQIGNEYNRLCVDAGAGVDRGGEPDETLTVPGHRRTCMGDPDSGLSLPHLPLTLRAVAPSLYRKFGAVNSSGCAGPITSTRPFNPDPTSCGGSLFVRVSGASGYPQGPHRPHPELGDTVGDYHPFFVRADNWAASFAAKLAVLTANTRTRADRLVATDRRSYNHSRDLLIGAGTGSLLLALAIGLLLSDSLLVPLQKTQRRLATIAAGDFSGRLEVPNRDEIGALAADVNRMSDELRRLYQELESASRHKSDFLATMSHELRTPLNAIIGFSEVLHEQMFGELNERQLAYVEDVLEAGRHLLSLINDVLDLSKVEAGKLELELSPVALAEVLRSAVSMHAERARSGGIELNLVNEPDGISIVADERRLRQIVFNLLSNAVKFTPADGRVDVSAWSEDGHIEIAVADTGPGIPPEDLETIFQEFEQTDDGKRAEGTGLGLPLSRKLVELHGGRLWAESTPGQGSTFRFTLPVGSEAA